MRCFLLAVAIMLGATVFSQSTKVVLDSANAMLRRRAVAGALPLFQKVMAEGDATLQRAAVNRIIETWVTGGGIALSNSTTAYGQLISTYMNNTFRGKESTMTVDDKYTAGLIFWSFGYSGAHSNNEIGKAIYYLDAAARGGRTDAVIHLAAAVKQQRYYDKSIQLSDIVNLYTQASQLQKTAQPLIDYANSQLAELRSTSFSRKTPADLDTARDLFLVCFNNLLQVLPDSAYQFVDYYWGNSFYPDRQDTIASRLLERFFQVTGTPQPNTPASKALVWHELYKYFYDTSPKTDTIRRSMMDGLRDYYKNDAALLAVIAQFLNTARTNHVGYALSTNTGWLGSFAPVTVSNPRQFFAAAALTNQDMTGFLAKNPPASQHTAAIATGYQELFDRLFDILSGDQVNREYRFAVANVGASNTMRMIDKLASFPEIKNNADIKHVYGDMAVVKNLAGYASTTGIPIGFDELPKAFAGWTENDKKTYDTQYLEFLLKQMQERVTTGKTTNQLANATGKTTLDFNDYDKAQQTIQQVVKIFTAN